MSNIIQIKKSTSTNTPLGLQFGELAYSQISDTLFIGQSDTSVKAVGGRGAFASLNSPAFTGSPTIDGTPVASTAFVQSAITAILSTRDVKESCRVGSSANVNINAPGSTLDGKALVANDRIFLFGQTNGAENGIWVWTGASTPLTRAVDANDATKVTSGMVVTIEQGATYADTAWFLKTEDPITLGTTPLEFINFPGAGGIVANIGLQRNIDTLNVLFDGVTIYVNASNQLAVKSSAIAHQVMLSNGVNSAGWGALPLDNPNSVTGVLAIANGGLGLSSAITGLLKGISGAYAAATEGVDYLSPSSLIDGGSF